MCLGPVQPRVTQSVGEVIVTAAADGVITMKVCCAAFVREVSNPLQGTYWKDTAKNCKESDFSYNMML